ncbi:MAG: phosphoribosylamine--glycine ligase, partial [Thermoplasmata archaeon]
MRVACVGGGAREHVIAETLYKSGAEIYAVMKNRNPGIMNLASDYTILKETDVDKVVSWCRDKRVELAVIGPEAPLAAGIVDALEKEGIPAVGPTKSAAEIETSKAFMRLLMEKYGIDGNLEYRVFTDIGEIRSFLKDYDKEYAVKPAGLTGGKGVKVFGEHLRNNAEALRYCEEIIEKGIGGGVVVIEEKAVGEEYTLQAFVDGKRVIPMPLVQDHKRAYEGDAGPNTGGMGSYSQEDGLLPFISIDDYKKSVKIVERIVGALRDEGRTYKGIIYGQFMLTADGPKIIEVNCRFGDPEAMNVLPLLRNNFLKVCEE